MDGAGDAQQLPVTPDGPKSKRTDRYYQYQPLNSAKKHVRLFRLAPARKFDSRIRGSLITISLDKLRRRKWQERRKWYALSYVWGTTEQSETIVVSRKLLPVTPTLHEALLYLRWPNQERYLWIDQISVNQEDLTERSAQVRLMRDIFHYATGVVAWLGNGANGLSTSLTLLKSIAARLLSVVGEEWWEHVFRPVSDLKAWTRKYLKLNDDSFDLSLDVISRCSSGVIQQSAWFQRLWTLQEAVVSRRLWLQAGRSILTWWKLEATFSLLRPVLIEKASKIYASSPISDIPVPLLEVWESANRIAVIKTNKSPEPITLGERILVSRAKRAATDRRDYVYCQLGLFNEEVMKFLEPDYSATIRTVFMAGTVAIMQADNDLSTLAVCCAKVQLKKDSALPSWCPEWSDLNPCGLELHLGILNDVEIYRAAPGCEPRISRIAHSSALSVRGFVVDHIDVVVHFDQTTDEHHLAGMLRQIQKQLQMTPMEYASCEQGRALCRTLIADLVPYQSLRADHAVLDRIAAWLERFECGQDVFQTDLDVHERDLFQSIQSMLESTASRERSLFRTVNYRLGQSCAHVRGGDRVCILHGAHLPVIVRRTGQLVGSEYGIWDGKLTYELIGGYAYVDGLVDGEGLEMAEKGWSSVEDICLV